MTEDGATSHRNEKNQIAQYPWDDMEDDDRRSIGNLTTTTHLRCLESRFRPSVYCIQCRNTIPYTKQLRSTPTRIGPRSCDGMGVPCSSVPEILMSERIIWRVRHGLEAALALLVGILETRADTVRRLSACTFPDCESSSQRPRPPQTSVKEKNVRNGATGNRGWSVRGGEEKGARTRKAAEVHIYDVGRRIMDTDTRTR